MKKGFLVSLRPTFYFSDRGTNEIKSGELSPLSRLRGIAESGITDNTVHRGGSNCTGPVTFGNHPSVRTYLSPSQTQDSSEIFNT